MFLIKCYPLSNEGYRSFNYIYIHKCKVYQSLLAISYNLFLEDKMCIWLIYLIGWGHQSFIWTQIRQRLKLSTMMWNHFSRNNKETFFHVDPQCKNTCDISVLSGDQKYGINEYILGKSVLALDFISAQVGQFTTNHHTCRDRRGSQQVDT